MAQSIAQPPASPPQGAGQAPGTPPFGSSPATGPTPNRGYEAAGIQKLSVAVKLLGEIVPLLGTSSEPGQAVLKALQNLSKHIQPGSVSQQSEMNSLQNLAMKAAQQGPQVAAMRQQAAAPGGKAA